MLDCLERKGPIFWITTGSIFVVIIGIADIVTGSEFAFALFYLIPIVLVAWFSGRNTGLVLALISSVMWFIADVFSGDTYSHPVIRYWNAFTRLGLFAIVTLLLPALKKLEYERKLARTDQLTGVANRREFFELLQKEIERSERYKHPVTTSYIDIDAFKDVNDRFGHVIGDKLLCSVVNRAKRHLRKTDIIARLGGDEFVILFPETDQNTAQIAVPKLQKILLDEMVRNHWSVTFSIGVLTCLKATSSTDELIKRADNLMYSVKKNGKNAIAYAVA